tara:strand:+ start:260 stop:721 length:462 start_codon:yes stop_codon:yes gene_type:complete
MSQRVNIQYSIEIDQLPNEVDRLVKVVQNDLESLSSMKISDNAEEADISLQSVFNINEIRAKIASLDHALMDVANIMNGYINFLTSPPQQEEAEESHEVQEENELYPASEVTGKFDDLESKLQQFKSNNTHNNYDPVTTQKSEFTQEVPKTTT